MSDYDHKVRLPLAQIASWLGQHHGTPVDHLEPIRGGYWSSAYSYRAADDALILRLGDSPDGYRIDQAARRFAEHGVPVPEVLEIGEALGRWFAVSRRHHGEFLEEVSAQHAGPLGDALAELLARMRAVPARHNESVEWYHADTSATAAAGADCWHDWLRRGVQVDETDWVEACSERPRLAELFAGCIAGIEQLLPAVPERRDLVHGDLLHQNVLVSPGGAEITAMFSWKCSARGDFLYDVAWCTLWRSWFPGIAATQLWERTLDAADLGPDDLHDAEKRHHCYQLQIAASHLIWFVESNDDQNMQRLLDVVAELLDTT